MNTGKPFQAQPGRWHHGIPGRGSSAGLLSCLYAVTDGPAQDSMVPPSRGFGFDKNNRSLSKELR